MQQIGFVVSNRTSRSQVCLYKLTVAHLDINLPPSGHSVEQTVGGEILRTRPAPCTMSMGSFPGVKRPGRGVDHLALRLSMGRAVPLLSPYGCTVMLRRDLYRYHCMERESSLGYRVYKRPPLAR